MLSIAIYSNCFNDTELLKSKIQDFLLETKISAKVIIFNEADKIITAPNSFDIYFLDMDTEIDVLKLGQEMMEIDSQSYFVYFSENVTNAYDCFKIRADYFMRKPIDPDDLNGILKDIKIKIRQDSVIIKTNCGERRVFVNDLNYVNIIKRSLCYHVVNGGTFDGQSLRGSFEKEIHPLDENPKLLFLAPSLLINVSNIKILDTDNITFEDDTVLYFPKKGFPIVQARWKKYNEG